MVSGCSLICQMPWLQQFIASIFLFFFLFLFCFPLSLSFCIVSLIFSRDYVEDWYLIENKDCKPWLTHGHYKGVSVLENHINNSILLSRSSLGIFQISETVCWSCQLYRFFFFFYSLISRTEALTPKWPILELCINDNYFSSSNQFYWSCMSNPVWLVMLLYTIFLLTTPQFFFLPIYF